MNKCIECEKTDREYTIIPVYDYTSGVMFSKGPPVPDTHFKCSNGHEWEIEE